MQDALQHALRPTVCDYSSLGDGHAPQPAVESATPDAQVHSSCFGVHKPTNGGSTACRSSCSGGWLPTWQETRLSCLRLPQEPWLS